MGGPEGPSGELGLKHITSSGNETIKEAARLKRKRHRYEARSFLAEGEDLLEAALTSGVLPRQVFLLEGREERVLAVLGAAAAEPEVYACSPAALAKLSELGSGTRVVAVFPFLEKPLSYHADRETRAGAPVLYLSGLGDPGNVGTLLRSATAFGAAAVILAPESADPYSPKALRATMGSIFEVPLHLDVSPAELASWAETLGLKIVCADPHQGLPVWEVDLTGSFVLVLGAERKGVPGRLKAAAREVVMIPQAEAAESINVAMAGTAILYEALRQRQAGA